jgi:fucose 4-O-acetylase-like acetyltransferase
MNPYTPKPTLKTNTMKPETTEIPSLVSKLFNLPYLQKTRYRWVDYIKGIAILLVVYRHVLIGIERSGIAVSEYMKHANMIFYSFRMPLFFILSGIFISASLAKRSFKQLTGLKFELLLYPYLVWVFLQITFQILLSHYTNSNRSWIDYTYIFYQPRNLDQFWYLPALFNVTIVYAFLKQKLKIAIEYQLILGMILYYVSMWVREISILSDWMDFYIFFAIGDAFSNLLFKEKTQRNLKSISVLILTIPLFLIAQIYFLKQPETIFYETIIGKTSFIFVSLIGCFFMFILSFRLEQVNSFHFLRIIGAHSLYIYVMHVFISSFVRMLFTRVFHITDAATLLISGIIISILASIIIYNLLIRRGVFWFLLSYRKNGPAVT